MASKVKKVSKVPVISKVPKEKKVSKALSKTRTQTDSVAAKPTGLTVKVFDTAGKSAGTISLPKEYFGQKPNEKLLSQAYYIYFSNSKTHLAHTKTRSEVRGGGRKPWRQKGTGNARAGSTRSPLWVGGGRVFGPRTRVSKLTLPKKMKRSALISALSKKAQEDKIKVISNLEKVQPKTKIIASLINKLETKRPVLLISSSPVSNLKLASRNIPQTNLNTASNISVFEILTSKEILISKEALEKFKI